MIVTSKKPIEELMAMVGDAKRIGIVGCSSCAIVCPDSVISVYRIKI